MITQLIVALGAALIALGLHSRTSLLSSCAPLDWTGKTILITGASTGIGRALALGFARNGATLFLAARNASELEAVKKECAWPERVSLISGDLARPGQAKLIRSAIEAEQGFLHLVILNHAYIPSALFMERDDEASEFWRVMDVNFKSCVDLTHELLPLLHKSQGRLAAIGTLGQYMPEAFLFAYTTSKIALQGFFDALALELKVLHSRATVTYVTIGAVDTDQYLSKVASKETDHVPFKLTPTQSAQDITCVIEKGLEFAFSPPASYLISWTLEYTRPVWVWINRNFWLGDKPFYQERVLEAQNRLVRQVRLE